MVWRFLSQCTLCPLPIHLPLGKWPLWHTVFLYQRSSGAPYLICPYNTLHIPFHTTAPPLHATSLFLSINPSLPLPSDSLYPLFSLHHFLPGPAPSPSVARWTSSVDVLLRSAGGAPHPSVMSLFGRQRRGHVHSSAFPFCAPLPGIQKMCFVIFIYLYI